MTGERSDQLKRRIELNISLGPKAPKARPFVIPLFRLKTVRQLPLMPNNALPSCRDDGFDQANNRDVCP